MDVTASWPAGLQTGVFVALGLFAAIGAWRAKVWFQGRRERAIQSDIRAGRYLKAIDALVKQGRLAEAAGLQERRGQPDAAAELFVQAGDVEAAARVHSNAGDWQMAAITLKEAGLHLEAAELYKSAGEHEAYAEALTAGGATKRAEAVWKKLGRLDRVADIRKAEGDVETAQKLRAAYFEAAGDFVSAAELYEHRGDTESAMAAWRSAGRLEEVGRLLVSDGNLAEGAKLLMDGGDFLAAAPIYVRLGKFAEAAMAAYRGGDVPTAIGHLSVIGDQVTIAKVFFTYGMRVDAKRALGSVKPGAKAWVACQEALAAAELEERNPSGAFKIYGALVEHGAGARGLGDQTRSWLLARFRMLMEVNKFDLALKELERAKELGLGTPQIDGFLSKLSPQLDATMTQLAAPGGDLDPETSQVWVDEASSLILPQHARYRIRARIGQGANGVVYRALDTMLDRPVVVKMIANDSLPSEMAREWFLREAQTAARLNHPNIVTIYDMGDIGGQPFIAMELVDGQDLKQFVNNKLPLDLAQVLPLFDQLGAAASYAHAQGVVHRDIKLDNLMITGDGALKLMDFGLAQAFTGPDVTFVIAGTPAYMSPEQIRGTDVDHQTDVYAMGVLLFKLLTGEYPFQSGNVLEHHRSSPIPDPRKYNPTITDHVAKVIAKAMAKTKTDRYEDADSMVAGLRSAAMPRTRREG